MNVAEERIDLAGLHLQMCASFVVGACMHLFLHYEVALFLWHEMLLERPGYALLDCYYYCLLILLQVGYVGLCR